MKRASIWISIGDTCFARWAWRQQLGGSSSCGLTLNPISEVLGHACRQEDLALLSCDSGVLRWIDAEVTADLSKQLVADLGVA